jgi:hypothetical protein
MALALKSQLQRRDQGRFVMGASQRSASGPKMTAF